jgi:hypothetical protein
MRLPLYCACLLLTQGVILAMAYGSERCNSHARHCSGPIGIGRTSEPPTSPCNHESVTAARIRTYLGLHIPVLNRLCGEDSLTRISWHPAVVSPTLLIAQARPTLQSQQVQLQV